jgi:hypothetical protein
MPDRPQWMDAYRHLILEDLAYHHMTVAASICGSVSGQVRARSWSPSWLYERDRGYCSFLLHADAGWTMNYETRWGAAAGGGNFFGELIAEGASGEIWTDGTRAVYTARGGAAEELPQPACPYTGWSGMIDQFSDALRGHIAEDVPELMPFDRFDGILRMLYAAVASEDRRMEIRF